MEEGLLPEMAQKSLVDGEWYVLLSGGKRFPLGLLSCLRVPSQALSPTGRVSQKPS